MGVPKFFRWLSERYPKIIQRHAIPIDEDLWESHGMDIPRTKAVDPLSECGLAPPIRHLFIDMNGVIHGCSHNNNEAETDVEVDEEEIFRNISLYLDRVVKAVQPTDLIYMAIDGVAPRAKLNQQRARRYRSADEMEKSIYDAYVKNEEETDDEDDENVDEKKEVEFTDAMMDAEHVFTSNEITPGTEFFTRCTKHLEHFIQYKLSNDWKHLKIIFSGPQVPGEGEHKIMKFLREHPTDQNCIMGQDGDLILLGLVTHQPNLVLLREKVNFLTKHREKENISTYVSNRNFEFLHMSILRDYLALELETSNVWPDSRYDLERSIDDFVFLTFLVGNDFLPHMPALDIADEGLELLLAAYKSQRESWPAGEYLTDSGTISSGQRLEDFLQLIGAHEQNYYSYKEKTTDYDKNRKMEAKFGNVTTPVKEVREAKEASDRESFRQLLMQEVPPAPKDFTPVMSRGLSTGLVDRVKRLLKIPSREQRKAETDVKARYYSDRFGFSPFDANSHLRLRKAYVEGLAWNLLYYYKGCPSWDWYYPYHYGPMISDLVDLDGLIPKMEDFEMGRPLRPFQQLMSCLPPSHAHLLPEPYQWLFSDESSPILDFYPTSFTVDMNGKRWPWEAVVLLPFIDSERLLDATKSIKLSNKDLQRNRVTKAMIWSYGAPPKRKRALGSGIFAGFKNEAQADVFEDWSGADKTAQECLFTLRDGSIEGVSRRKMYIDVHGRGSAYTTALLQMREAENLPVKMAASSLIGTIIYVNYPYLLEAFVTAVSDDSVVVRGDEAPRFWTNAEAAARANRVRKIINSYATGSGYTGSGGLTPTGEPNFYEPEQYDTLLNVRPLQGVAIARGHRVKKFAKFEVEVPMFVKYWKPLQEDPRLDGLPALLERDPYTVATKVLTHRPNSVSRSRRSRTGRRHFSTEGSFSRHRHMGAGGFRNKAFFLGALAVSSLIAGANAIQAVTGTGSRTIKPKPLEFAHGTTTLAFVFEGGIVAAVDSRASLGSFVGSKTTQKVLPISSHVLGTMAGGAADCLFWIRKVQAEAALHLIDEGYRMTVCRASRLLANALYQNKGLGLSVGTMIMGFDEPESKGPKIFYIDDSGTRIEGDCFAVGSGSTYALGILDTERRFDMTENEAIALGIKAIRHSTFRDAYSGGFINVYLITRDGWTRVFSGDVATHAAFEDK